MGYRREISIERSGGSDDENFRSLEEGSEGSEETIDSTEGGKGCRERGGERTHSQRGC